MLEMPEHSLVVRSLSERYCAPKWSFEVLLLAFRWILLWDSHGPLFRKTPPASHLPAYFSIPCVLLCILRSSMHSAILSCGVFQTADQNTVGALRGQDAFFDHSRIERRICGRQVSLEPQVRDLVSFW